MHTSSYDYTMSINIQTNTRPPRHQQVSRSSKYRQPHNQAQQQHPHHPPNVPVQDKQQHIKI